MGHSKNSSTFILGLLFLSGTSTLEPTLQDFWASLLSQDEHDQVAQPKMNSWLELFRNESFAQAWWGSSESLNFNELAEFLTPEPPQTGFGIEVLPMRIISQETRDKTKILSTFTPLPRREDKPVFAVLVDLTTHKTLFQMRHEHDVHSCSFSIDERYILTSSADGTARIWDAETGVELDRFFANEAIDSALWGFRNEDICVYTKTVAFQWVPTICIAKQLKRYALTLENYLFLKLLYAYFLGKAEDDGAPMHISLSHLAYLLSDYGVTAEELLARLLNLPKKIFDLLTTKFVIMAPTRLKLHPRVE